MLLRSPAVLLLRPKSSSTTLARVVRSLPTLSGPTVASVQLRTRDYFPSSIYSNADTPLTIGRTQAAPLTAWLRVPLSWYHSTTYAYYPDETHSSIRRTYICTPSQSALQQPQVLAQRQFCGYCGTHLSNWTEQTKDLADMIDVTLGSLHDEDLEVLEAAGLLGSEDDEIDVGLEGGVQRAVTTTKPMAGTIAEDTTAERARGSPWFEELVEHSRLGRVRRQKGGHMSADGTTRVEWEVVEIGGAGEGPGSVAGESSAGKRKLEDR